MKNLLKPVVRPSFRPSFRPLTVIAAACLFAACNASQALSPLPPDIAPKRMAVQESSLAQLKVVDRQTGQALPIVWHQGRAYVAGQPGRRYALALRNMTADERVLAVMSVDGVNVVTGDTVSDSQSGYVFGAGERYEINGWRKSQSQIAAFEFTALENSYAARTGRPGNVGEIRVALFRENVPVRAPAYEPYQPPVSQSSREDKSTAKPEGLFGSASSSSARRDAAPMPPAPSAPSAPAPAVRNESARASSESTSVQSKPAASITPGAADKSREAEAPATPATLAKRQTEKLGTAHGRREQSYTEHTSFQRAQSQPNEVLVIYYDSRENLIAQGVLPRPRLAMQNSCSRRDNGYAPDPC